jgi:hypothetical protein
MVLHDEKIRCDQFELDWCKKRVHNSARSRLPICVAFKLVSVHQKKSFCERELFLSVLRV